MIYLIPMLYFILISCSSLEQRNCTKVISIQCQDDKDICQLTFSDHSKLYLPKEWAYYMNNQEICEKKRDREFMRK